VKYTPGTYRPLGPRFRLGIRIQIQSAGDSDNVIGMSAVRCFCLAIIAMGCISLCIAQVAVDRNPLIGTWVTSGLPQYSRVTCKIEPWESDGLKVVYDLVGRRGGVTHLEWTGKLNGKDYPLEGAEEVVSNAYTQSGDRAYNIVLKVDGRMTTTSNVEVSQDGKTMTVTTGQNITVYKKR
jgi:hypothetical protein